MCEGRSTNFARDAVVPTSKSRPKPPDATEPAAAKSEIKFYRPESYQRSESVGWMMHKLKSSITRQVGLRLQDAGLTHAQWVPLMMLRHGGACSTAQLVRELDVDAGAFTRLLDRLEAKGLVQRERSEQDRRVVLLALSEEGVRLTTELQTVLSDVLNAHLRGFSHAEWRLLLSLLQRMIDNGEALMEASGAARAGRSFPLCDDADSED